MFFFISLLCSTPSSLFFMILYSIYMLHDRSRQSTKTCAECHMYSLIGYGGGILDEIFHYLHLYEVLRGEISKVRAFLQGQLRAARDRAGHPMRFFKFRIIFSQLCVFVCVFLKFIFFRHYSLFCVLCLLCVFLKYVLFRYFSLYSPFFLFIFKSTIFLSRETLQQNTNKI